jgi:hypothetical protein
VWIKTKTETDSLSELVNTDKIERIAINQDHYILGEREDGITILLYGAKKRNREDAEKKMAKIERCLRDGRNFCDLDGEL